MICQSECISYPPKLLTVAALNVEGDHACEMRLSADSRLHDLQWLQSSLYEKQPFRAQSALDMQLTLGCMWI